MDDKGTVCLQGSVVVAPATTTEFPYTLDHGCIRFRGVAVVSFKRGWFSPVISPHDQIEIVKGLNDAYQKGYATGFAAPKYITRLNDLPS